MQFLIQYILPFPTAGILWLWGILNKLNYFSSSGCYQGQVGGKGGGGGGNLVGPYRVICWEIGWLVRGKVSQQNPVPGGDQNVLAFDVSVADALLMALRDCMKQLKSNPVLHILTIKISYWAFYKQCSRLQVACQSRTTSICAWQAYSISFTLCWGEWTIGVASKCTRWWLPVLGHKSWQCIGIFQGLEIRKSWWEYLFNAG